MAKKVNIPHNLTYREYQKPLMEYMRTWESFMWKRAVTCWHRRAGKDKTFFNLVVEAAIREVWGYAYILPTYTQWKKVIWDSIDKQWHKFKDHIPKEIMEWENGTELKFTLKNGSFIQVLWSENIDSIRWTNWKGVIFSEYAFQNPTVWDVLRPILAENGWWAIFNSTPNGKNHFYDLYNTAKDSTEWYCQKLSIVDTWVVSEEYIQKERNEWMSEEMIQQEFYCSFDVGAIGSYYADQINDAREQKRIVQLPFSKTTPIDIYFDLWRNDATSIWFKQNDWQFFNFIGYFEDNWKYIDEYFNYIDDYIKELWWQLWAIYLPHDSKQKKIDAKYSTFELAEERYWPHKIEYITQTKSTLEDINTTRKILPRCRFDIDKTAQWIKCLENYKKDYDDKKKIFRDTPRHDWASHGADSFRYFAVSHKEAVIDTAPIVVDFSAGL